MASIETRLRKLEAEILPETVKWCPESAILRDLFGLKDGECLDWKPLSEKEMLDGLEDEKQ